MKRTLYSVIIIASALSVRAQTITWGTPQTISSPTDVATTGTLFGTWAPFDTSAGSYPVNGVTFSPISLPDDGGSGFDNDYTTFGSPGTTSANYNTLLEIGTYGPTVNNPGSVTATISWGGMTPGDTYEVELWAEDVRVLGTTRYESLSGGSVYGVDTSSVLTFSDNAGGNGEFITGTFVAGSGTETIGFTPGASEADAAIPQFNLLQVRDLTPTPEPSTLALAGIGGLGLLLRRLRK